MIKGKKGVYRGYQEAIRKYKHRNTRLCEPWKDDKTSAGSNEPKPSLKPNPKVIGQCIICNRSNCLTMHHIIPNSIYRNNKTCKMCIYCHSELHRRFSNAELYSIGNTVENIVLLFRNNINPDTVKPREPIRKFVVKETRRHYILEW